MSTTQEDLVNSSFGNHAAAYVTSPVHAAGEDLQHIEHWVRAHPGRVLDLGTGGGHAAYAAARGGGEVTAYDLSAAMLDAVGEEAERRGHAIQRRQGSVEYLPFEDGSFDVVLSRLSAHHWTDFGAGLRGAARVLRSRGSAVFIDVVSPGTAVLDTFLQAVEILRDMSHVRDRSLAEWISGLAEAGFAPPQVALSRMRLDFQSWLARIGTPPDFARAIRGLQAGMSDAVRLHFAVEPDGSFCIDIATMTCRRL